MRINPQLCIILASTAGSAYAHPGHESHFSKAVYLLTNNPENAVIGVPIQRNGLLGHAQVTLTGGIGESGLDNAGVPAGPDSLFSQGAVAVAGEYVFAVNPGSNSVSMLEFGQHDPSKLTLVGQPALVPGDFPNTVAASSKGRLVCVGATGTKAGISCTSYNKHGLGTFDELRPFELNQTTPPVGPAGTLSHVLFSEDDAFLYAAVKGDGTANNTGFFSVFPVNYGCSPATAATVAREDIRSSPNGTNLLFGSVVIPSSGLVFVTDPGFGAAVLKVNDDTHEAELVAKATVPGQQAICWAAYSYKANSVFVTDVLVNRLVELDANDASILRTADLPNDDPGLIDLVVVDRHVYALSPGNGTTDAAITVFDIEKNEQVQRLSLKEFGAGPSAMGMAYLEL
ncbi:uncharacterized protein DSM5745_02742 [Aspergillus mulundensis]|uniref:3-carboxymuconate cyclase n=1 Tax=Aspergillus mulundensis TaxID=1810919 RepID=A0A3D8SIE9_9EURO|nr:Uncharacterized protein DSM5745_02742 [Aspergillus mulundensis]RDW86100.1 Uncharacterized protein DSM5745_02742 [Aspergillus mulundensis]